MTTSTVQPGMRAAFASPFTPIAVINGTPIYPLQGGRSGGGGVRIAVGDDDGSPDDDLLDDDYDEDDADEDEPDEEQELPASMRGKPKTKAKPTKAARRPADDEDDEPEDDDEDETPGAIRRMEEALSKANKTAARYRRAGKAMERLGIDDLATWITERGIDPETGRPFGSDIVDPEDGDDTDDSLFDEPEVEKPTRRDAAKQDRETIRTIRAAEKRAEAKVRAELIPILAQVSATSALREAGFKGDQKKMDKILRLIDPNDLDVITDDGEFEIEGLDDAIAGIRDDFPELFRSDDEPPARRRTAAKSAPARRVSGARDVDGDGRGRQPRKQGGWMDQIVARMDAQGR
jgi:hypothetical protein